MMSRGQAADTMMIVIFLFLNGIVIAGILGGIGIFYGNSEYDGRAKESEILADKILRCALEHDFFSDQFDISRDCGFSKDVLSKDHLVYVYQDDGKEFIMGTLDFKNQCFFSGAKDNSAYPRCAQRSFFKGNNKIVVVAGSNQRIRGVNT